MKASHVLFSLVLLAAGFSAGRLLPASASSPPVPVRDSSAAGVAPASAAPATAFEEVPEGLQPEELRTIDVFRRASRSVVSIRTVAIRKSLFSLDVMQIPQGAGSGFVWDREGHIVTNYHVIEPGNAFLVGLADGSEWEAEVVGFTPAKDLAVLRIDAPKDSLVPLEIGRSSGLVVGQQVLALGNPFGWDQSLTTGVLSAVGRELESRGGRMIHDVLQTDAAINPGNSGGPLLDSSGRLIGVNTAIISPSGASAGIGFSIPVDTVTRLVPQLIEHGRPIQPGVGFVPLDDTTARRNGFRGVVVRQVMPGTPADRVGIEGLRADRYGRARVGDVIVAVDGEPVETTGQLLDLFESRGVGNEVTLTLEREGRKRDVRVELVPLN